MKKILVSIVFFFSALAVAQTPEKTASFSANGISGKFSVVTKVTHDDWHLYVNIAGGEGSIDCFVGPCARGSVVQRATGRKIPCEEGPLLCDEYEEIGYVSSSVIPAGGDKYTIYLKYDSYEGEDISPKGFVVVVK